MTGIAGTASKSYLQNLLVTKPILPVSVNIDETADRVIRMVEDCARKGYTRCQWTVRFPDMSVAPYDDVAVATICSKISEVYHDSAVSVLKQDAVLTKNCTHYAIIIVDWS